jgi:hypothetical protein
MSSLLVDEAIETRRLPIFLRLQEVWCAAQAKAGRLLRLFFLRDRSVPVDLNRGVLLFIDQLAIPGRH